MKQLCKVAIALTPLLSLAAEKSYISAILVNHSFESVAGYQVQYLAVVTVYLPVAGLDAVSRLLAHVCPCHVLVVTLCGYT